MVILLVCVLFPSGKYGKYDGGWNLVDLRNVCSYFINGTDITSICTQSPKSTLKLTAESDESELTEFICRKSAN